MKRPLLWVQLVLAAAVGLGVWLQVYFIASFFFGAEDALDIHESIGFVMHILEALVFLASLGAWWRNWGKIGHAFGLIAHRDDPDLAHGQRQLGGRPARPARARHPRDGGVHRQVERGGARAHGRARR